MNADEITHPKPGFFALDLLADGAISDFEALRALAMQLGEVEDDYQTLAKEREHLREQIGQIVARQTGQKAEVKGFGQMAITGGGETVSYDAKALDNLMAELMASGDIELMGIGARLA